MELVRHFVLRLMMNNVILRALLYLAWITKLQIRYRANSGMVQEVDTRGKNQTRPNSIRISQHDLQIEMNKFNSISNNTDTSY